MSNYYLVADEVLPLLRAEGCHGGLLATKDNAKNQQNQQKGRMISRQNSHDLIHFRMNRLHFPLHNFAQFLNYIFSYFPDPGHRDALHPEERAQVRRRPRLAVVEAPSQDHPHAKRPPHRGPAKVQDGELRMFL